MSAKIGSLHVDATLESAAFGRGADQLQRRLNIMRRDVERTASKLESTGRALSIGLTLPLAAFGIHAVRAASDAQELQSAFDQTFGHLAGAMTRWAEATGDAMGRSTQEIQAGANAFGLYFNQAARTRGEAARLSQQFTVLAQDLSSFHNTGVDEALLALRSGLSGETEPLRRYGVFLNEAAVAAQAAAMGLRKVNGAYTDQQKIMARAALIMQQTRMAHGDVVRTAGSSANQLRSAAAAWQELSVTMGTRLLPVLNPVVAMIGALMNAITSLPGPLRTALLGLAALGAISGPLLIGTAALVRIWGGASIALTALAARSTVAAGAMGRLRVAMLAFITNPWVLAITAIGTALYYLAGSSDEASASTGALTQATGAYEDAALAAALATGQAADEARRAAAAKREEALQVIANTRALLAEAQARAASARARAVEAAQTAERITSSAEGADGGGFFGHLGASVAERWQRDAERRASALEQQISTAEASIRNADRMLSAAANVPPVAPPGGGGSGSRSRNRGGGGGGGGGPSARELADRRAEIELQQRLAVAQAQHALDEERSLQHQLDLRARQREYQEAGFSTAQAQRFAERDMQDLRAAEAIERARLVGIREEELDLTLAQQAEDFTQIETLERAATIRERIEGWQRLGLSLAEAERRTTEDMVHLEATRLAVRQRLNDESERNRQLDLARLRGDGRSEIRMREREIELERRAREIAERDGVLLGDARETAGLQLDEEDRARMQGNFREAFRGGVRSALDGDLKSFVRDWWRERLTRSLEDALNNVADMLYRLFQNAFPRAAGGGRGESDAGILGAAGQLARSLFGGSTGASSGGSGGGGLNATAAGSALGLNLGSLPKFKDGGTFAVTGGNVLDLA
jgi:hypothetical protein